MSQFRACALIGLLALSTSPAVSSAATESIGVVAVADPPGPSADLAELTRQLRDILAERTAGVVEANLLRARMTGQTSAASLSELDRAYAGALVTFKSGDLEGSIESLEAIVADLERVPESAEAFEHWKRAMLRLARAQGGIGHTGEERATLMRLIRAAPNIKPDPQQYPRSFEERITEVRAEFRALPVHRLTVSANSDQQVTVYVDGRAVGSAPVTLSLIPGRYRVSGVHGTLRVPPIMVEMDEAQAVVLDLQLAHALRPSVGPGLAVSSKDRARRLVTIGAWLGVDRLLAVSVVPERGVNFLDGAVYDTRHGMAVIRGSIRLAGTSAAPGALAALASFFITGEDASKTVVSGPMDPQLIVTLKPSLPIAKELVEVKPSDQTTSTTSSLSTYKTMGWGAVGAGGLAVALGGVAILESASASRSYDKAHKMVGAGGVFLQGGNADLYNHYISSGDSAHNAAVATGIGAGLSLAAAGILGYLSYQQTGEVGPFRF